MRAPIVAAAAFLIASFGCTAAWSMVTLGEPFSARVEGTPAVSDAGNAWSYTLCNTSSSPSYTIWLMQVEVETGNAVVSVASPAGWSASIDDQMPNLVTWFCGPTSLAAGCSQNGFRAVYSSEPVRQGWTVMFDNADIPGDTPVSYGDVSMPEPGSIVALLAGLVPVAHLARRRRN
jgi:hypothetical protein